MLKKLTKKQKIALGTAIGAVGAVLIPVFGGPVALVGLISTLGSLFGAS